MARGEVDVGFWCGTVVVPVVLVLVADAAFLNGEPGLPVPAVLLVGKSGECGCPVGFLALAELSRHGKDGADGEGRGHFLEFASIPGNEILEGDLGPGLKVEVVRQPLIEENFIIAQVIRQVGRGTGRVGCGKGIGG